MTNKYLDRPTKEQINALPEFKGLILDNIYLVHSAEDIAFAREKILQVSHVGFDTESKPTFVAKEVSTGPHLVQICTLDEGFLFSVTNEESNQLLAEILESEKIVKVGFGLKSDRGPVQRKLGVNLNAASELTSLVKRLGYRQAVGMKPSVAIVLGENLRKSKKVTLSNWSKEVLTESQMLYAANDAYACLRVFLALNERLDLDQSIRM